MANMSLLRSRRISVAALAIIVCLALLLFFSRLAVAQPLVATWYGPGLAGNYTANGEIFDPSGYTAAHMTYAFNTKLIVTYNGQSVVVRVNDRGPYVAGKDIDLSQAAAEYIGLTAVGSDVVDVQVAAPSTPVGPYAPANSDPVAAPAPQPEPAPQPVYSEPAPQPAYDDGVEAAAAVAAQEQAAEKQAVEEEQVIQEQVVVEQKQYVAEDQYAAAEEVEEEEELTELPDTSGVSYVLPLAGALLIAFGLAIRILRR